MLNPLNLVQMMRTNPQQLMQSIMGNSQINNNPISNNALQMLTKNDADGLTKLAENLCRENGMNYQDIKRKYGR